MLATLHLSPTHGRQHHSTLQVRVSKRPVARWGLFHIMRAAEVYRPAILRNCPGVIICHNHPSGDPSPSDEDIAVTKQLALAGQQLDIELVDHLIIGNHRFVSLKERLNW